MRKNTNITLDKAYADFAKALKKPIDQLTDDEKRQALFNQAIKKSDDSKKKAA